MTTIRQAGKRCEARKINIVLVRNENWIKYYSIRTITKNILVNREIVNNKVNCLLNVCIDAKKVNKNRWKSPNIKPFESIKAKERARFDIIVYLMCENVSHIWVGVLISHHHAVSIFSIYSLFVRCLCR